MDDVLRLSAETRNKALDLEAQWFRHMLTLAVGALAVLAALEPTVPAEGFARYFLATTWSCLGLGIFTGGAATFLEVDRAWGVAEALRDEVVSSVREARPLRPVVRGKTNGWLELCKKLMVVALGIAAVCLAVFATIVTLSA